MEKTYKIVKSPYPAMSWEKYKKIILKEWKELLEKVDRVTERDFQHFFESHPCMLPWIYGVFGIGAHGMFPSALISQPVLPSFTRKVPDFMFIARDSAAVYAVLIEIEDPRKPWATSNGCPSAKLTQAINQLKEWQAWFSQPLNCEQFKGYYNIPQEFLNYRLFLQKYILIYGRQSEAMSNPEFAKKRFSLQGLNEIFMTYDRLTPNRELSNCLCVKIDQDGYRAITVPPTILFYPSDARDWSLIRDKDIAVSSNRYLTKGRKQFLVKRWPYWDEWGKSVRGGSNAGDYE